MGWKRKKKSCLALCLPTSGSTYLAACLPHHHFTTLQACPAFPPTNTSFCMLCLMPASPAYHTTYLPRWDGKLPQPADGGLVAPATMPTRIPSYTFLGQVGPFLPSLPSLLPLPYLPAFLTPLLHLSSPPCLSTFLPHAHCGWDMDIHVVHLPTSPLCLIPHDLPPPVTYLPTLFPIVPSHTFTYQPLWLVLPVVYGPCLPSPGQALPQPL